MQPASIFDIIERHNEKWNSGFYLIPSENFMIPAARIPFLSDSYNRYYLSDQRVFGYSVFPGGIELGELQEKYVEPRLSALLDAKYISLKPLSGMTALLIGLAGLVKQDASILILSAESGGHFSTEHIGRRLGLKIHHVPVDSELQLDIEALKRVIHEINPALVYWDQSNVIFPDNPKAIADTIKGINKDIILYYDVSHLLGFVMSGLFENPLRNGFDMIGGSTHKSFPGPQKGFIATNNAAYFNSIQECADVFISHPQMAHLVSLAITLEHYERHSLKEEISNSVMLARKFGEYCTDNGLRVVGAEKGYTNTHQLWIHLPDVPVSGIAARLTESGIYTNCFERFAPVRGKCCRLGFNEIARLNISDDDLKQLSHYMTSAINATESPAVIAEKICRMRKSYRSKSFELFDDHTQNMIYAVNQ